MHKKIDRFDKALGEIINQDHLVSDLTTDSARNSTIEAIDGMCEAIANLHDPSEGSVVLMPDTNALILSPALQGWEFGEFPQFELLIVPALLCELDDLKINHRNPDVREKCAEVGRQIKEYRRRGALGDGVDVVSGKIRIRSKQLSQTWGHAPVARLHLMIGCSRPALRP